MAPGVWVRAGMVVSILLLVVLILVTPFLLGRPPSELTSLPAVIIGMSSDEAWFVVNLGAAVNAYQYDHIRLTINGSDSPLDGRHAENESYTLQRWVPRNGTEAFSVNVYFVDQQKNYFEYNVTASAFKDSDNRTVLFIRFPYERDNANAVVRQFPPDDFRLVVPRRGRLA